MPRRAAKGPMRPRTQEGLLKKQWAGLPRGPQLATRTSSENLADSTRSKSSTATERNMVIAGMLKEQTKDQA
jgi:hypothetical protein